MFKHTLIALMVGASLQATEQVSEALNQSDQCNATVAETAKMAPETSERSLTETIELIIQDLEKALVMMDHPQRVLIEDNLANIYDAARTLIKQLRAAAKTNNLTGLGVEKEQALRLFRTYARFKKKFADTLTVEEVPADQAVEPASQN